MLAFLKYIVQLILSPAQGWDDLREDDPDPGQLLAKGFYPLLGVAAATEFLALAYGRHEALGTVLVRAVALFGAYFVAVFVARLIFDYYLNPLCAKGHFDTRRASTLAVCGLGAMVFIQIIANCLPWSIMLVRFLPLYVVLVLFKAIPYMGIRRGCEMRFTLLSSLAIVAVPMLAYYLLYLLIP